MTALEKLEANERKQQRHLLARGECYFCHKSISLTESHLAHIVPKGYIKIYGDAVINHDDNMVITCPTCNSKALMDPKSHPLEAEAHLNKIRDKLLEDARWNGKN